MFYLRNVLFFGALVFACALLLQGPALADPPDWAPAHGYRAKHHKHKHHHKHHRYQDDHENEHGEDDDDDDRRYGYYQDRDWHRDAYRDERPHRAHRREHWRTVEKPVFVNGKCSPRRGTTGADAGAALGAALGSTVGGGNALAQATGAIVGAMLGSKADVSLTTPTDEDCFTQVLEGATDQEQVAWDNATSSTHYELTPIRSYQRSGRVCRELVTTVERRGKVREVYQTACRDPNGSWQFVD